MANKLVQPVIQGSAATFRETINNNFDIVEEFLVGSTEQGTTGIDGKIDEIQEDIVQINSDITDIEDEIGDTTSTDTSKVYGKINANTTRIASLERQTGETIEIGGRSLDSWLDGSSKIVSGTGSTPTEEQKSKMAEGDYYIKVSFAE